MSVHLLTVSILPFSAPVLLLAFRTPSVSSQPTKEVTTSVPQQERLFGPLAESNTPTGYEPNDLVELDNMEKFLNRSVMTSACDSAESIATPPLESDLDDEQIQVMLASPLYLQERSKCSPTSSLSLLLRKLSVKLVKI